MKARAWRSAGALLLAAAVLPASPAMSGCAAARATGANSAGLVIVEPGGAVVERCVSFTEESITGLELLARAGLAVRYEDFGAQGAFVCSIDGVGCSAGEPCMCMCARQGPGCEYWGYYRVDPATNSWSYSSLGAGARVVRDGDVDGWRWGEQSADRPRPPAADAAVCARVQPVASGQVPEERGAPVGAVLAMVLALAMGAGAVAVARARRRRDA